MAKGGTKVIDGTTEQQKLFAYAYFNNKGNGTQAAITAGYSEKTATSTLTIADDIRVRGDITVTTGLLSAGTSTITLVGTGSTIQSKGLEQIIWINQLEEMVPQWDNTVGAVQPYQWLIKAGRSNRALSLGERLARLTKKITASVNNVGASVVQG